MWGTGWGNEDTFNIRSEALDVDDKVVWSYPRANINKCYDGKCLNKTKEDAGADAYMFSKKSGGVDKTTCL